MPAADAPTQDPVARPPATLPPCRHFSSPVILKLIPPLKTDCLVSGTWRRHGGCNGRKNGLVTPCCRAVTAPVVTSPPPCRRHRDILSTGFLTGIPARRRRRINKHCSRTTENTIVDGTAAAPLLRIFWTVSFVYCRHALAQRRALAVTLLVDELMRRISASRHHTPPPATPPPPPHTTPPPALPTRRWFDIADLAVAVARTTLFIAAWRRLDGDL